LVTQIAEQQMQVFSSCPPAASYAEMGAQGCSSDGAAVKQQLMSALADDTRSQVRTCKPPPRGVSTVVSDPDFAPVLWHPVCRMPHFFMKCLFSYSLLLQR